MIDPNQLSESMPALAPIAGEPLYMVLSLGGAGVVGLLIMLRFAFLSMKRADQRSHAKIKAQTDKIMPT